MSYWEEAAKDEIAKSEARVAHAYSVTPKEYRWFLIVIKQNKSLGKSSKAVEKNYDLGLWQDDYGNVKVPIQIPYMSVDGRVKWARDEHKKEGKKLIFCEPKIENGLISVTVESEIYGAATGTSKIGKGGGVDATNPIENAETSAIGRALGFRLRFIWKWYCLCRRNHIGTR